MVGPVLAFVAVLIIALVALSIAFDSILIAVGPALVLAGSIAYAVLLSVRKR